MPCLHTHCHTLQTCDAEGLPACHPQIPSVKILGLSAAGGSSTARMSHPAERAKSSRTTPATGLLVPEEFTCTVATGTAVERAKELQDLMKLVLKGRAQALAQFVRQGGMQHLDVNELMKQGAHAGLTPLHCAVARGDEAEGLVECLLSLGAQAHVRAAKTGASALHAAAEKGQGAVVRLLLEHGAPHGAVCASGDTALYLAAAAGNVGAAEALVKAGAAVVSRGGSGDTPFHAACSHNDELAKKMVEALCLAPLPAGAAGADGGPSWKDPLVDDDRPSGCGPVAVRVALASSNQKGLTPLHLAAAKGLVGLAETLLQMGAEVGAKVPKKEGGRKGAGGKEAGSKAAGAKEGASKRGEAKAKPGQKNTDKDKDKPAERGGRGGKRERDKEAGRAKAGGGSTLAEDEETPLHLAARGGHTDMVRAAARLGLVLPSPRSHLPSPPPPPSSPPPSPTQPRPLLARKAQPYLTTIATATGAAAARAGAHRGGRDQCPWRDAAAPRHGTAHQGARRHRYARTAPRALPLEHCLGLEP